MVDSSQEIAPRLQVAECETADLLPDSLTNPQDLGEWEPCLLQAENDQTLLLEEHKSTTLFQLTSEIAAVCQLSNTS